MTTRGAFVLTAVLLGCSGPSEPEAAPASASPPAASAEAPSAEEHAAPAEAPSDDEAPSEEAPVNPCSGFALVVGEPSDEAAAGPNDEDPVGRASHRAPVGMRYRCGNDSGEVALGELDFECHGAGCEATIVARGGEVTVQDPQGGLTDADREAVTSGAPEGATESHAVVRVAERGFVELTIYDVISTEDGFRVERRGDEGSTAVATVPPAR